MIHLATERSGVVSFQSFERLYFFKFSNYFHMIIFFSDVARVVLHGTSFSLPITLLTIVLDQRKRQFLQLGPSRTAVFLCFTKKFVKK